MYRVLLVEDDARLAELVTEYLSGYEFAVELVTRGDEAVARQAVIVASSVLAHIEQAGWLCGVPLGAETPGLMSGVAGIGYNLLRLAMPTRIPSVLLVEPPRG